jgi:hypothetical protein
MHRGGEIPLEACEPGVEMHRMAGETEERLILEQQVVGDGPVSIVADSTIFVDRFMFENEGPLFRSMTGEA